MATRPKGVSAGERRHHDDSVQGDKIAGNKIGQQIMTQGGAAFLHTVTAQTVVGRDQITHIYQSLPFAWPKQNEEAYLRRLAGDFTRLIEARTPGTQNSGSWDALFVQPILSSRRVEPTAPASASKELFKSQRGTWSELVREYPQIGLLVGEPHDGQSLLMQWIAADLALTALTSRDGPPAGAAKEDLIEEKLHSRLDDPRHLPIYLSVSRFPFRDAKGLLDMAAFACGQAPESLHRYWFENGRRICLLIDDSDLIPHHEREGFCQAIADLNASRNGIHSLIAACRPGSGPDALITSLQNRLGTDSNFTQWVMLPLDDARIAKLLDHYEAEQWLKAMIEKDERLRWLVRRPGVLADLVRATRGLSLIRPPQNLAQLYQLFVDEHLFSANRQSNRDNTTLYHYRGVKQRLLAYLAFRMLSSPQQNSLVVDDLLCRDLASRLEVLAGEFARTRRYMPADWNATDALAELCESPVVNREAASAERFEFESQVYRDYYAALFLRDLASDGWKEACERIRQTKLDGWIDALILLSGMPPTESTNALFNEVLVDMPELAADLWLEKGSVGFNKIPACVQEHFNRRRIFVPDRLDYPIHPAVRYFREVLRDSDPQVMLQAVNGLMQMGLDAIDPLLDAVENCRHPVVIAAAVHALFHMGEFLADSPREVTPLLTVEGRGFVFDNLGTCNATIGPLELVNVPRTCRAELSAAFGSVDFDLFGSETANCFELWCTPISWFAMDYFQREQRVDWIGLAAACQTIARCADLIIGKARLRPSLQALADEMTQSAIHFDVLGCCIARDLALDWQPISPPETPSEFLEASELIYKELRLFFNRTNRSRTLARAMDVSKSLKVTASITDSPQIGSLELDAGRIQFAAYIPKMDVSGKESGQDWTCPDLPDLASANVEISAGRVLATNVLGGIRIGHVVPAPFRAAEGVSIISRIALGECLGAYIEGIRVDELSSLNGVRIRLELSIDHFQAGRLVGIVAYPPADTAKHPSASEPRQAN